MLPIASRGKPRPRNEIRRTEVVRQRVSPPRTTTGSSTLTSKLSALAQVRGVQADPDREADALAHKWLDQNRVAITGLTDDGVRCTTRSSPCPPTLSALTPCVRPKVRAEETEDSDGNKVPTQPQHLMADPSRQFPTGSLNNWESSVLESEMRQDLLGWYRNPGRASEDSLAVAYKDGKGNWRRMCPDFVFFSGDDRDVKVSLIEEGAV
jgi:type III restriction enzyme